MYEKIIDSPNENNFLKSGRLENRSLGNNNSQGNTNNSVSKVAFYQPLEELSNSIPVSPTSSQVIQRTEENIEVKPIAVTPEMKVVNLKNSAAKPQKFLNKQKTYGAAKPISDLFINAYTSKIDNSLGSTVAAGGNNGTAGVPSTGSELGDTIRPKIVSAPKPEYPNAARRAGFEGKVIVSVTIAADGTVKDSNLAKTSGRTDCDESAITTLTKDWRFEPALKNGNPVEVTERIAITYRLEDEA